MCIIRVSSVKLELLLDFAISFQRILPAVSYFTLVALMLLQVFSEEHGLPTSKFHFLIPFPLL